MAQGQPWRTEPEIDLQRQNELDACRSIIPNIEKGIYPFYEQAVRANRQLAVLLQAQGLNEDAARFAYYAQVLQKTAFRYQLLSSDISFLIIGSDTLLGPLSPHLGPLCSA